MLSLKGVELGHIVMLLNTNRKSYIEESSYIIDQILTLNKLGSSPRISTRPGRTVVGQQ